MSEAGAGMVSPPSEERREILQPSQLPVSDNSSVGAITTSDHYCVSHRVRDGAGLAVINIVTNTIIIITSLNLALTLCHI